MPRADREFVYDRFRRVSLFPGYVIRSAEPAGAWSGSLSGVVWRKRRGRIRRGVLLRLLARLMDEPVAGLNTELCRIRTEPFFCRPVRVAGIRVALLGQSTADEFEAPRQFRSRRNGHFIAPLAQHMFPGLTIADSIEALAIATGENGVDTDMPDGGIGNTGNNDGGGYGATRLSVLAPEGISVISDIDDTIKESDVENRRELLANTFLREFREIDGMAGVYAGLAARGAAFHYVTASPWQLHQPLSEFLDRCRYPEGSMHFRRFRLSDHLLKRLGVIHRGGKSAAVRRIIASCPGRQFILIGDSGEKDAEIYARCFRDYPRQVRRIFIRLVRPRHRFRESILKARIGLPPSVFTTFENSGQLGNLLSEPE